MLGRAFLIFALFAASLAQFLLDGNRDPGYVLASTQTVPSSYSAANQLLNFYYAYDTGSVPPRLYFFFGGILEASSNNQFLIFLDNNGTAGRQVPNSPTASTDDCLRFLSTTNTGFTSTFSFDSEFNLDEFFLASRDLNQVLRRGPLTLAGSVGNLTSPLFATNWTSIPSALTGPAAAAWGSGLEFFITGDFSLPIRVAAILVNNNCRYTSNQVLPPCTGATVSTFDIRTFAEPDLCPGNNSVTIITQQAPGPCNPNPCNAATEDCQATAGAATCVCKQGLQRIPGGCVPPGAVGIGCNVDRDCGVNEICSRRVQNPTGGSGICQCATGFVRNATTSKCESVSNPPIPSAVCWASGDPHFGVFDSSSYSFQGKCDYVLVRSPTLEIQIRLGECIPGLVLSVSCVRGIAFFAGPNKIFANESGVWNNGVPLPLPATINGVIISNAGTMSCGNVAPVSATFPDGATLEYSQRCASVQVPGTYFNNSFIYGTKGLCGSYNFQPLNDGVNRAGTIIGNIFNYSDPNLNQNIDAFGNAWKVQPVESLFFDSNPDCPNSKREILPRVFPNTACANNNTFLASVMTKCTINFPGVCRSIDSQQAFLNCIFDYCNFGDLNQDWIIAGAQKLVQGICNFGGQGRPSTSNQNFPNPFNSGAPTTPPGTTQPSTGTTQPSTGTTQPSTGTTQPSTGTTQPSTGTTAAPTTPPDPCNPNPCQNDTEICQRTSTRFACVCRPGLNRVAGVCVPQGQVATGCQSDTDCKKANEICARGAAGTAGTPGAGVCICTKGFVRNDKTGQCEIVTRPPINSALCQGYGDPHYSMFDTQYWSTQAKCDYVLVRAPTLEIQVRQGECFPPTIFPRSCVKGIAYLAGSNKMLFNESGAYNQGAQITSFPTTVNGIQIKNTGNVNCMSPPTFSATFPDGTILEYGFFCLSVRVPGSYANSNFALGTKGLCGRFNLDTSDDGTFRNGTILNIFDYTNPNISQIQEEYAESWKVPANESIFLDSNPSCAPIIRRQVNVGGTVCETNQTIFNSVISTCTLNVPENCTAIDVQALFFNCVFDTCSFPEGDFVGIAQDALDAACNFAKSGLAETGGSNPSNPFNPVETATTTPGDESNVSVLLPTFMILLFAILPFF